MSNRHKAIKKAMKYNGISRFEASMFQKNQKKILSCKFCGSTEQGERMSSCKKRAKLQGMSIEYTLGNSYNGLNNFIQKIMHNTEFSSVETMPGSYVTIGENSKSSHFFIHRVWQTQTIYNTMYESINNVIFEFSYITKLGGIDKKKHLYLVKHCMKCWIFAVTHFLKIQEHFLYL